MQTSPVAFKDPKLEPIEVLLDASALLLATGSTEGVLSQILDLANRIVAADAYAVWHTQGDGGQWRMIAGRGFSPGFETDFQSEPGVVLSHIVTVPDVYDDPTLAGRWLAYQREGIASLFAIPLLLSGQESGYITFYWRQPCSMEQIGEGYASAFGNLASAALALAKLHQQNIHEKARLAFLAKASAVLASSLEYETTLHGVAQLAASHFADWCTVHLVEHGILTGLGAAHKDPSQLALSEEYSQKYPERIRDDRGLGLLLKTGQTQLTPVTDELLIQAAKDEEHLRLLRLLGVRSILLVPLISRGHILGAIRFVNCHTSVPFTQEDIPFAQDLARRAAVAIENAKLHRAVTEQENKLRLTHAAARLGSWSWDLVHRQIDWSPEFKALHGLPPDSVATFEAGSSLMHPDDRDEVLGHLKRTLASNDDQISYEHRTIRPDGRVLWIHSRGRIERDAHGAATGMTGISIDVTERHQAEEALRRTEKLAAAGRLAATVAHEVNNPLEALMNLIYLSRQVSNLPDEAASLLATADSELNRMAHIVRQTLGFYRESSHPVLTYVAALITEALALYQARADARGIALIGPQSGTNLQAYLNGGEIRQVITNLVSNAIDASPKGAAVRVTLQQAGDFIQIAVHDTGSGISDEHRERLFEPFFTTKADVGTGLGLWVSKGIVENHHGTIHVVSSPRGSIFTVRLPLEAD